MKNIKAVCVLLLILALAGCVGNKQTIEKPNNVVDVSPMPTLTPVDTPVEKVANLTNDSQYKKRIVSGGIYGGIPSTVNKPPEGTIIDVNLTEYYGVPTATGDGKTYWFIGGWGWFNESEMMNLPSDSLMYDISPYAISSGGGNGILVPINPLVLVLFVVSAISIIMVLKKNKKKL